MHASTKLSCCLGSRVLPYGDGPDNVGGQIHRELAEWDFLSRLGQLVEEIQARLRTFLESSATKPSGAGRETRNEPFADRLSPLILERVSCRHNTSGRNINCMFQEDGGGSDEVHYVVFRGRLRYTVLENIPAHIHEDIIC